MSGLRLTERVDVQHAPGGGASADVTAWPEFHNGVATGRILLSAGQISLNGHSTTLVSSCLQNS